MKYTVTWSKEAERQLTELWLSAADRAAITQAANQIDRDLQHDPQRHGESRMSHTRIHFAKPLGVFYRIDESDRTVNVLAVWRYDTHEDRK